MPTRATEEQGFGLIELLFAMVMLNVGILALVAAFQSGALALARSAAVSNGTAVADKVMEVYRGVKNCGIYLNATSTGADTTDSGGRTISNGIPAAGSSWYALYKADTGGYPGVNYFSYSSTGQAWETNNSTATATYSGISTCSVSVPTGAPNPNQPVQYVQGPDGQYYPVFVYVIVTTPSQSGWTAGNVKEVTVAVLNPRNTAQILAQETSLFDPTVGSQ